MLGNEGLRFECQACAVNDIYQADQKAIFHIDVPIQNRDRQRVYQVTLRCEVSAGQHRIQLHSTHDREGNILQLEPDEMDCVLDQIALIESRRLCGTHGLCPHAITDAIRELPAP